MARRPKLKALVRENFNAEALGCQCSVCPYKALGAKPVTPPSTASNLVVIGPEPSRYDDKHGKFIPSSQSKLLSSSLANYGCHEYVYRPVTLCRAPEGAKENERAEAIRCCAGQRDAAINDARQRSRAGGGERVWALALGPEAHSALTDKLPGSLEAWAGAPQSVQDGLSVISTWDPGYVLNPKGTRYALVWSKHLERVVKFAGGQLKAFEWPKDVVDDCTRELEKIAEVAESGGEVSVDIETRSLGLDSAISCVGFATSGNACCVQLPLSSVDEKLVRRILSSGVMVGQNISAFDRRVLKRAGYELTPYYEDTMLAASILDPQLPKNLGALASAEFHASAHKAEFKTDRESGIMLGDWTSTDPAVERERRIYCLRDSYITFLLWQVQKRRLSEYGAENAGL